MQVRFNLKDRKSDSTLIYLIFNQIRPRLKYSTKQKIDPKFWDDGKMRVRATRQFKQYPEFNTYLDRLENTVLNTYRRMINDGQQPTREAIILELNKATFNQETKPLDLLTDYIDHFIKKWVTGEGMANSTVKNYKNLKTCITNFEKHIRRKIYFQDITLDRLMDFVDFLQEEQNLNPNTTHKHLRNLKKILDLAMEEGFSNCTVHRSRRLKVQQVPSFAVYLDMEKLTTLSNLDLSGNAKLEKTRDRALIQAFTGVDYSTYPKINKDNIITVDGIEIVQFMRQKTQRRKEAEEIGIPLHPIVKMILDKYDGYPPEQISNQKTNDYLKELCELAGFTEPVHYSEFKKGKRKPKTDLFYQKVASHTMRRSFATNSYLAGTPIKTISKLLGHSRVETTEKYIKATGVQTAIVASQTPFFKGEGLMRRV